MQNKGERSVWTKYTDNLKRTYKDAFCASMCGMTKNAFNCKGCVMEQNKWWKMKINEVICFKIDNRSGKKKAVNKE